MLVTSADQNLVCVIINWSKRISKYPILVLICAILEREGGV